jgi:hypothetical protein
MEKLYRSTGNSLCIYCTPLPFTLTLLFLLLFTFTGQAQVNAYAKVTGITTVSGKSQLAIANSNTASHGWVVNEEVIVIQMQDNVISGTANNASFGLLSGISSAGLFEVATITATGSGTITLNKLLTNPFHFGNNSKVQVVSFTPLSTTGNFTTTGSITALPWNGNLGRGGVVAIQVPGIFTLKHPITVDGLGFSGGAASNNASPGCGATTYISTSTGYGAKGEGIYLVDTTANPSFFRGRARLLSGGGGGNSSGSGGGGGSNYSAGGSGATYWSCSDGEGLGGVALNTSLLTGARVFMGGGGGGGQGNGSQTNGGNGGGIIIIRAGALNTNCGSSPKISANGAGANTAGDDGAGGGGAAGTILLQISSYTVPGSCPLTIEARGGDGGDAGGLFPAGAGGGGGQGAVLIVGSSTMNNITKITVPGNGGSTGWFSADAPSGSGPNNGGVVGGIGVVLPVHLTYFTAENKNGKAVLTWTSTDENNVTYTIERSTDGSNFTAIGSVTGTSQSNYTYTDPNPINGRVYYRLVMTSDLTAQTTYSSVVSVSESNVSQVAVAYPNPAHDHFYLRISGDNTNKLYKVAVTDLAGQVVYTTTGIPANNIIKITPGRALKPGLYMYKVSSDGFEQTGKLMIQ